MSDYLLSLRLYMLILLLEKILWKMSQRVANPIVQSGCPVGRSAGSGTVAAWQIKKGPNLTVNTLNFSLSTYIICPSAEKGKKLWESQSQREISQFICSMPLCKNCEIFERFLENKIESIPMFPLI